MKRFEAIQEIVRCLDGDELVVSSNGMISRELFTIADAPRNFYMIGSMGLASSIGLGLALSLPARQVVVIEGDGNVLMNLGSAATIGHLGPANLIQVVLDNEAHDSTGGQPTVSHTVRLEDVARAAGYPVARKVTSREAIGPAVRESFRRGPGFILVKVEKGSVEGIKRVSHAPEEIRARFQRSIQAAQSGAARAEGPQQP
jgi:thiamine pyrophosphate-dependent acetolactate synthase large subunit-like protein